MSRPIDTYDRIAIAEIVIYTTFLAAGIYLCIRHGVRKSTGWVYLVVFAIARILGSALRLASISDPRNMSLYAGWQVLNGFGLGPLILLLLGMLGRCYESINRQGHVVVKPLYQRLIKMLMLAGVILTIIGGTRSSYNITSEGVKVSYNTLSKVGAILMIAVFVLVLLVGIIALLNQGYVAQGEHRILLGVFIAFPMVAVRLAYSCALVLGGHQGSVWLFLGVSMIMEMAAVLVCASVGLTLAKVPPVEKENQDMQEGTSNRA